MASEKLLKQGERRRKRIMGFLERYIAKNGMSPTVREIAEGVGLKSPNSTTHHLLKLVEDGDIKWSRKIARGISLVRKPE